MGARPGLHASPRWVRGPGLHAFATRREAFEKSEERRQAQREAEATGRGHRPRARAQGSMPPRGEWEVLGKAEEPRQLSAGEEEMRTCDGRSQKPVALKNTGFWLVSWMVGWLVVRRLSRRGGNVAEKASAAERFVLEEGRGRGSWNGGGERDALEETAGAEAAVGLVAQHGFGERGHGREWKWPRPPFSLGMEKNSAKARQRTKGPFPGAEPSKRPESERGQPGARRGGGPPGGLRACGLPRDARKNQWR